MRRHPLLFGVTSGALSTVVFDEIPASLGGVALILGVALWAAGRGKKRSATNHTRRAELEQYLRAEEREHRRRREQGDAEG